MADGHYTMKVSPAGLLIACFIGVLLFFAFQGHPVKAEDPPDTSINCKPDGSQVTCTLQNPPDDEVDLSVWSINNRPFLDWDDLQGNSFTFNADCGATSIRAGGLGVDDGIQSYIANAVTTFNRHCPSGSSLGSSPRQFDPVQLAAGTEVNIDNPAVHARRLGASGIGVAWIIDAGFIDAIDVWGTNEARGEVCLPGGGRLLFLDAKAAPRAQSWLESYQRDGVTCAQIDGPGTVVLMPGEPTSATAPTVRRDPYFIADSLDSLVDIENCQVTARVNLNFRAGPAQRRLGSFSGASSATVLARTPNWFKVRHQGAEGWISAHYVTTRGDCG